MPVNRFTETYPPIEALVEMGPEELAPFVLKYLSQAGRQELNRDNFSLGNSPEFIEWAGISREQILERLMVAWMWLEKELFIAPRPGHRGEWVFITPAGEQVLQSEDFDAMRLGNLLSSEGLDPILARKVKPLFLRGDYDTAIFQAFKEVEVRVRRKATLSNAHIGVSLMREAFNPTSGILSDQTAEPGEKVAMMELFAGAIGVYKNPSSHRDISYSDPKEAADIIGIANQLLRILG